MVVRPCGSLVAGTRRKAPLLRDLIPALTVFESKQTGYTGMTRKTDVDLVGYYGRPYYSKQLVGYCTMYSWLVLTSIVGRVAAHVGIATKRHI